MKIESPVDYEYSSNHSMQTPHSRVFRSGVKLSKNRYRQHLTQKKTVPQRKLNYFQKMYRQVKKKTYVNLLVRKLKQSIIPTQNFNHQLCQNFRQDSKINQLKTIKWSRNLQIGFMILQILLTIIVCISTSLCIVFPTLSNLYTIRTLSLIISFFYLSRIILCIFTRSSIKIKNDRKNNLYVKKAFTNSINFNLFVDILLIFVYFIDFIQVNELISIMKSIILFKVGSIIDKITHLQIVMIKNLFNQQYWALLKILLANFLLAHFVSIVLIYMADLNASWMIQKNIINLPLIEQYIWSYYWATTIMYTVGFGDIVPTNANEACVMIFVEALTCILLAYNINSVGNIITKITSYEEQKDTDFKTFYQMEGKQLVSDDIKDKITNYISQSIQLKRKFNVEEQKKFLSKLPKSFNQQFKKQSTLHIFKSIPFFRNLSFKKLSEIALKLQKRLTHPQEILIQSGKIPQIFIINHGQISMNMNRIGLNSHGKQIQTFHVKQNEFKILSLYFFINKQLNYDIKSKNHSIVYYLSKKQLENCLSAHNSSYQYYCMIKDKDRYNPSDWQVNLCTLCKRKAHHTLFQCPKLHFMPIRHHIISKIKATNPHRIQSFSMKNSIEIKNYFSCLKLKHIVQEECKQFNAASVVKRPIILNKRQRHNNYENEDSNMFCNLIESQQYNLKLNITQNPRPKLSTIDKLDKVYKVMGQQLRNEIFNKTNPKYNEELQTDIAHNYACYFHSHNPNLLGAQTSIRKENGYLFAS